MRQELSLNQQTDLHLTAELRQGLLVLGMSGLELSTYLHASVEENYFLCLEEATYALQEGSLSEHEKPLDTRSTESMLERLERNAPLGLSPVEKQRKEYPFEQYLSKPISLKEHLEEQLNAELRTSSDRLIGSYLVGNIDHNGYLRLDIVEAAHLIGLPPERIVRILKILQSCQPEGIGARNLRECLLLQLASSHKEGELVYVIVANHLDDVASGKLVKISKELDVPVEKVQEAVDFIRCLDPRPGRRYDHDADESVIPELAVRKFSTEYRVELLDIGSPSLSIDQEYVAYLDHEAIRGEAKKFLKEKHKAATSLIASVEQRKATLLRVSSCLMQSQHEFLEKGFLFLRPITMLEVATLAEVSESTVSRVVNGNFIQTPHGTFELRSFFSSHASKDNRQEVSSSSVKQLIKTMIEKEDKGCPLSDAQIVDHLAESGITVSRRTVNKYRHVLGIFGTAQRKRHTGK